MRLSPIGVRRAAPAPRVYYYETFLVVSGELVARVRDEGGPAERLVSLGERSLRGRAEPVEVFVPGKG